MTVDHDGKIRMDCSSPYAMARLVGLKDQFRVAFANDPDSDRHGIVTPSAGLMNPNHYLAVAIRYLLTHRPQWPAHAAVGKTLVSSSLIDRVVEKLGRRLYEVPGGVQVVRAGPVRRLVLLRRRRERRRQLPAARRHRVDDRQGRPDHGPAGGGDHRPHGQRSRRALPELTAEFGTPYYTRIDAPATPEQKARLRTLSPEAVKEATLAGEPITAKLTRAPGNNAAIGGLKVVTQRLVRGAAVRHGEHLQDLRRELQRTGAPGRDRRARPSRSWGGGPGSRGGGGVPGFIPRGGGGGGGRGGGGGGQSWWQALPLGPTGYGNSPYQPLSSFAGNELLVSPDWLMEDGLLREDECERGYFSRDEIDYDAVMAYKRRVLKTAWANFVAGAHGDLRAGYEQFRNDQAHWLDDYALFRALKARYNGAYFLNWPRELVERVPSKLAEARGELSETIDQVCFAQFLIFRQGERQAYAQTNGVRLIGDLPFFVSPDSSDVWSNPGKSFFDRAAPAAIRRRRATRLLQRGRTAMGQSRLRLG